MFLGVLNVTINKTNLISNKSDENLQVVSKSGRHGMSHNGTSLQKGHTHFLHEGVTSAGLTQPFVFLMCSGER